MPTVHNIKTALYAIANGAAGLTALIASSPARFYPYNEVPQESNAPFCTYRRISERRNHAMGADTKKVIARYQVDSWAPDNDTAESVAVQVKAAFNRYRGTSDTVVIDEILLIDERDITALDGTFAKLTSVSTDFLVGYQEPANA